MSPIKFSHWYEKLQRITIDGYDFCYQEPKEAHLISAAVFDLSQMPEDFLFWDTLYFDEKGNSQHYPLEPGKYIVLIFFDKDRLFSTLRPYTERKFAYYLGQVGRTFGVVMK